MSKFVYDYNNTYHRSICKKAIAADYSALTEEIETNPKAPKFIVGDWVRKMVLANITSKIGHEKYVIDFVLKLFQMCIELKIQTKKK